MLRAGLYLQRPSRGRLFRDEGKAERDGIVGLADVCRFAVHPDRASFGRRDAEDRPRDIGTAGADQTTEAVDVMTELKHYGLHRHFTAGSSVLMFGGGMKKGLVHGATSPDRPSVTIEKPVSVIDLHATIFTAMGISPKTAYDVEKRPFDATEDGVGVPVKEIFA